MAHLPLHYDFSLFTDKDTYHYKEGSHFDLYHKLGSHHVKHNGKEGVYFSLWAPHAKYLAVVGDFNDWDRGAHPMYYRQDGTGIWECFIEGVPEGSVYKYWLESHFHGYAEEKSDPHAFYWEQPPRSATRTWKLDYEWSDQVWMECRGAHNTIHSPISVYEVHLASWRRVPEDGNRSLNYRELADQLAPYVKDLGYTHVELLPITEHPFFGSWGYQCLGYFAPTARLGTPQDFMYFVDTMHQYGIGVILDWVPSHFAIDMHGLSNFDGTSLYEHSDPRQGFHPEWGSAIFNLGRNEVKNFLISSALFWFEQYHIDGIRVDAVASMLYLDYAREEGQWVANQYGGKENLESVQFLQTLNHNVYGRFPDVMMIAEESTDWPMVTKPTNIGGLGFEFKWNMGWMHDSLTYFKLDPIYRQWHHDQITFSIWYAFHEQYMLSLSHDEVVHMKGSMMYKMAGDYWQKFANMRALFAFMFAHPGKKLTFMGMELGQFSEWDYESSLDWHVLDYPLHGGLHHFVRQLHKIYRDHPALWANDHEQKGFAWVDNHDRAHSVVSFLRFGDHPEDTVLCVCNFTPEVHHGYRVGVPFHCHWEEILNSDSHEYGGSNVGNCGGFWSEHVPTHGHGVSLSLTLPPLGVVWMKPQL